MSTTTDKLKVSQDGRVLTIRLHNPPMNFLTSGMMTALNELLVELADRKDIGSVILTSAVDGVFLTHFDVDEIESAVSSVPFAMPKSIVSTLTRSESTINQIPGVRKLLKLTPMAGVADMNVFHEVTGRMRAMNKVFIAAINGRAMGGGCELALACDFRLMVEGDTEKTILIGQPEILLGLIPGGGGTQMLTRSLGVARALEHCLEGKPITPNEALALGMINRVVPATELMAEAKTLAIRMAKRSPQAVKLIKEAIYQASSLSWNDGMTIEKNAFLSSASQTNTRRAMTVYIGQVRNIITQNRQLTLNDFHELIEGNATDMTS